MKNDQISKVLPLTAVMLASTAWGAFAENKTARTSETNLVPVVSLPGT